jgi:sulfur carrier protein ThiS
VFFGRRKRSIRVTLLTHGLIARVLRAGAYDLAEHAPVKKLLEASGPLPRGMPVVILVRGERVEPDRRLADGDEVTVVQFAAGG